MQKNILLKLTGEVLLTEDCKMLERQKIESIAKQIKELKSNYNFSIVIGGGNFFRGSQQGNALKLTASIGHQVGMVATMMNGLIIQDIFEQNNIKTTLFCALSCPQIGNTISQQSINEELNNDKCLIFSGGSGNPFFTTDTNAVLRALQINAHEIWKATNVDGVYSADPRKDKNAKLIKKITFEEALKQKLNILDTTAYTLADQHDLKIRVFNGHTKDSLINAAKDENFGSIISTSI